MPESNEGITLTQQPVWHMVISPVLIIVYFFMVNAAFFLLTETALSFLGLGVRPPEASWGAMLSDSLQFLRVNPDLIYPAGIAIAVTVVCLMVIAENIRNTFDFTA